MNDTVNLDKRVHEMTDAELADLVGEGIRRWREKQGREPTDAEAVAIATLALGARLVDGEPGPVLKGVGAGNKIRTRIFKPADERRSRTVLDLPPRSHQADRVRALADKLIQEGYVADRG